MRILKGKFTGRDLTSPLDFRVRPTAENVRGAMLDLLAADLKDARVIELFAGTGALAIEAISRGARTADFVETRPSSLHALKANIGLFRLKDQTRVFKKDAVPFAAELETGRYDIAFADPPYGSKMLDHVIGSWRTRKFSRVLAVEHELAHVMPKVPKAAERRVIDDTVITIYRI
ncbi:MAG: RsmD family RNA methyltransferase [Gemmatimonadetes bacterium]|nr:RsmD family RNA methyltransferase [Gemmatimonadota bacterium]